MGAASEGPAELEELLALITGDEEALTQRYGSLQVARRRFKALRDRGEFGPDQGTTVDMDPVEEGADEE
jgi:hypothetical protein